MNTPRRRILLVLDSAEDDAALEAATALALGLGGSLRGLFVEDTDLLRLAGLPFPAEVSFTTLSARPIELGRLERDLRRQAERLRLLLEAAAESNRLPWSFAVVRDALLSAVAEAAAHADIYVLGRPVGPPRHGPSHPGPVLVYYDGSGAAQLALEAAAAIAAPGAALQVLLPAGESRRRLEHDARRRLLALGLAASGVECRGVDGDAAIAAVARAARAGLLVMAANAAWSPDRLARLHGAVGCPLAVVLGERRTAR